MNALTLLLIGFAINVLCFMYVFQRVGFNRHKTISDHVASGPARPAYIVLTTIATGLVAVGLALASNAVDNFRISILLLNIVSAAAYMVVVFVPRTKKGLKLHDQAAIVFGISFVLILIGLFLNAELNEFSRTVTAIIISILFLIGAYIYDKNRKNYAIIQSAFYVLCFLGLGIVLV